MSRRHHWWLLWAITLAFVAVGVWFATSAEATPPPEHKVVICHATPPDTAAQGWVSIEVDVASVGYQQQGHESEHDADIIPPYEYEDFSYPGKNWTQEGQAIWNNDCQAVEEPSPSPTPSPSPSPEPSPSPDPEPSPEPEPSEGPTPHVPPNHPSPGSTPKTGPMQDAILLGGIALALAALGGWALWWSRRSRHHTW